jgi:hypothetical protein
MHPFRHLQSYTRTSGSPYHAYPPASIQAERSVTQGVRVVGLKRVDYRCAALYVGG